MAAQHSRAISILPAGGFSIKSRRSGSRIVKLRGRHHALAAQAVARQESGEAISKQDVVTIPYAELLDEHKNTSDLLDAGFGPDSMGIVAICEVPGFCELRSKLLWLAQAVAYLPEEVLHQLEDPASRYSFGWSHGKEVLQSGQPDSFKGSFYANPMVDTPTLDHQLAARYPSCCRPNIWPTKELPEFEATFKSLGRLILDVGLQLAYVCDKHVSAKGGGVGRLHEMLRRSLCHKGRLLHYYPCSSSILDADSWCGWHVDHGSLTGLTCAMYVKDGQEVPCPSPEAGLYVKTRSGNIVKADLKKDSIAYQMGQTSEILSGGILHATPHCVRAAAGVERNTFAVFMQPHWDEPLNQQQGGVRTFGAFAESLLSKYYKM